MSNTENVTPDAKVPTMPVLPPQSNENPTGASQQTGSAKASTPTDPVQSLPSFTAATLKQKVLLAIILSLCVAVLLPWILWKVDQLNLCALEEVSVDWEMVTGVMLKPGPSSFRYDAMQKKLIHCGIITAERKLVLRELFSPTTSIPGSPIAENPTTSPSSEAIPASPTRQEEPASTTSDSGQAAVNRIETLRRSYNEAVDNLAYLGNFHQGNIIRLSLLLGCLGGALGGILRCLIDFTGHASYTQLLDLKRWWPLYFTRPLVGGILGFVLIVLFKAKLIAGGSSDSNSESFWWLGVAVLGGFSTGDVTLRLRTAAKAIFGEEEKKK